MKKLDLVAIVLGSAFIASAGCSSNPVVAAGDGGATGACLADLQKKDFCSSCTAPANANPTSCRAPRTVNACCTFVAPPTKELTRGKLTIEDHRKDSGYRATHVLAQYGRKRLALNEYRRFAGMKCELQLTSALFHAWSEIEHDILYKRCRPLRPLPRTVVQALKEQLNRAMEHHIQPASEILEAAARQAMRARPGG